MLRQIATSTFLWSSSSTAISLYLPALLASAELIHFPTTVSTVLFTTSIAVLTPLGAARGFLNGTESTVVPAAGNLVAAELEKQNLDRLNAGARSLREHADQFDLSSSLLGTSGFGTFNRGVLGLVLPSTEVLLEHVAKETSNTGGQEFLNLAKGATNGLIAGQITNVRDKLTLLGAIVVGTVVVGTVVSDQAAGKLAKAKEKIIKESLKETKEKARRVERTAKARTLDGGRTWCAPSLDQGTSRWQCPASTSAPVVTSIGALFPHPQTECGNRHLSGAIG
jgi:hypothetical protein